MASMAINLDVLIEQAKLKRDAARRAVEAEFQETVKSVELIRRLASEAPLPDPMPGTLKESARKVVRGLVGREFTVLTVAEILRARYPNLEFENPTLSGTLARLAEEGEAEVVTLGAGRRPTVYRRSEASKAEPEEKPEEKAEPEKAEPEIKPSADDDCPF